MIRNIIIAVLSLNCISSISAAKNEIVTFDLSYTRSLTDPKRIWDETHFVSSLQGIVNRHSPNLYIFYSGDNGSTDKFWLDRLISYDYIKNDNIKKIDNIKTLAYIFKDKINGLVVYDPNVPATSNVASTVAGIENLATVRYDSSPDSLYSFLTEDSDGPKLPVKRWLVNKNGKSLFTGKGIIYDTKTKSTGSSKCDAYIWAKEKYLDTGKCDPQIIGYYVDSYCIPQMQGIIIPFNTLVNHDYIISKKGFFLDLDPWEDEAPVDDRNQKIGTDFNTFKSILQSANKRLKYKKMISVSGYLPLWFKYTNIAQAGGIHEPVYGEFQLGKLLTSYNALMDADAIDRPYMANASIYSKFPLKLFYNQNKPTIETLKSKGYITKNGNVAQKAFVSLYVGDYDSAAWMYNMIPKLWTDNTRGSIPLGWAFNPNLAERFPLGMHYIRDNASVNDCFITGASGSGYIHPGFLTSPDRISELPSGIDNWVNHSKKWLNKFDISITGFIIDGFGEPMRTINDSPEIWDAYAKIAPDGIGGQFIRSTGIYKNMPYIPMEWQYEPLGKERLGRDQTQESFDNFADYITKKASKKSPSFAYYRTILWHPFEIKKLMETVKVKSENDHIEFVDPYTLMLLIKQFHNNNQKTKLLKHGIWELNDSVEVISNSDVVDRYDIRDLFGQGYGRQEHKAVAFQDGVSEPFTHWVEWKTKNIVKLEGFNIYARGDKIQKREDVREFKEFRIYGKENPEDNWKLLDSTIPTHPYDYSGGSIDRWLYSVVLEKPFIGSYFRAEFDQYDSILDPKRGPRIMEIEGIGSIIE